jgi:hypothetical protein
MSVVAEQHRAQLADVVGHRALEGQQAQHVQHEDRRQQQHQRARDGRAPAPEHDRRALDRRAEQVAAPCRLPLVAEGRRAHEDEHERRDGAQVDLVDDARRSSRRPSRGRRPQISTTTWKSTGSPTSASMPRPPPTAERARAAARHGERGGQAGRRRRPVRRRSGVRAGGVAGRVHAQSTR